MSFGGGGTGPGGQGSVPLGFAFGSGSPATSSPYSGGGARNSPGMASYSSISSPRSQPPHVAFLPSRGSFELMKGESTANVPSALSAPGKIGSVVEFPDGFLGRVVGVAEGDCPTPTRKTSRCCAPSSAGVVRAVLRQQRVHGEVLRSAPFERPMVTRTCFSCLP